MKIKSIPIISILASISLIGLTIMQAYWISNAIKVKEKNFENNVYLSVTTVIYSIEKYEKTEGIRKNIDFFPMDSLLFNSVDSIEKYLSQYSRYFPESLKIENRIDKFLKKSSLLNDIFENILNYKNIQNIEDRIDPYILDSLLKKELKNKGINIEYEFGIYSSGRRMLVIEKTGRYSKELLKNAYKFALYPSDIAINPGYLLLYFPNRKNFILTQIWVMLLVSIVFISILIYIFSYTIFNLVKHKKISEMKSDLINNITHEFKTPISTISLACEALNDKEIIKSEDLYQYYLDIINEENNRIGTMAEKVLQAAIFEKGVTNIHKEITSIHQIIKDVTKNILLQVEKKNGKIIHNFNAKNDNIAVDKIHISNVFFNLLDNANKYTPESPQITVSTEDIDEGIIISISDNGIGISHSNQKKIFDSLYRVYTGNIHNVSGYGLGLAYVKTIIEKHNGSIKVESELKKGSTFKIFLPIINN